MEAGVELLLAVCWGRCWGGCWGGHPLASLCDVAWYTSRTCMHCRIAGVSSKGPEELDATSTLDGARAQAIQVAQHNGSKL